MKILVKNQRVDMAITAAHSEAPSAMADGEVTENQANEKLGRSLTKLRDAHISA